MPQSPATLPNIPNRTILNLSSTRHVNNVQFLCKLLVINPMTAGSLVFNDCPDVGSANISNTVYTLAFGNAALNVIGAVIDLNVPLFNGLTCSSIGAAGNFTVTYAL
jgi:hypothetical protein